MTARTCGSCTLCCTLVPVASLAKKAGQRCLHQRHASCAIYAQRPPDCATWSCTWLTGPAPANMRRPDHSRYVVDPLLDTVWLMHGDDGRREFEALQIWLAPDAPDAWQDPALLDLLDAAQSRAPIVGLVRRANIEAFGLIPPSLTGTGKWGRTDPSVPDPSMGRYSQLAPSERPPL